MSEIFSKENIIKNHMIFIEHRKKPKELPLHEHDFLEIAYITAGSAIHHYRGKQILIKNGDFFFIDYNSEHRMTKESDDFETITCTFVPEFIDHSLLGCSGIIDVFKNYTINLLPHSLNGFYSFHDESGKIRNILQQMLEEYEHQKPGYLSFLRTYLLQLILLTIRKVDVLTSNFDERIIAIINYINAHYNEPIKLESFSNNYFCSLSNMSILFKSETGVTFTEYVRKTRIDVSCRLLTDSQKSIDRIANEVGYNDTRSFRKHFKAYIGMTPCSFRKKYHHYKVF